MTRKSPPRLAIVIPAYNEEMRLPQTLANLRRLTETNSFPWSLKKVLVVNDGSVDGTRALTEQWAAAWPLVRGLHFNHNLGKGAAVFAGLDAVSDREDVDWILVADADEATPWSELVNIQKAAGSPGAFLIFGSRQHAQSRIERRQVWWRERMGRTFNWLLRALTGLPFKDTQCGFKLFKTGADLEWILNVWTVARFAWDAELILHAYHQGLRCDEFPIEWRHIAESRVHPIRDGLQMAGEILRIRLKRSVKELLGVRPVNTEKLGTPFRRFVKNQVIPDVNHGSLKNRI